MQIVPRARHRDVKETTLFFDFCNGARREIRRQTAVDGVQKKY